MGLFIPFQSHCLPHVSRILEELKVYIKTERSVVWEFVIIGKISTLQEHSGF